MSAIKESIYSVYMARLLDELPSEAIAMMAERVFGGITDWVFGGTDTDYKQHQHARHCTLTRITGK